MATTIEHGAAATPASIRVLLVEDAPPDAELAERELRRAGVSGPCERVETTEQLVRALRDFAPDVVLTDHALPGLGALDALRLVREWRPGTAVIIVSGSADERVSEYFQAGAADYLTKADLTHLGAAVQSAVALRTPLRKLSPRQREVLELIVQGHPTRDIAARLGVSVKTVEAHRAQVMHRLEIRHVAGLVRYALRIGLIPPEP
jgi:DNA-binding NarL/FixJ family response regulator